MTSINAEKFDFKALNEEIRKADKNVTVSGCNGQRFIGAGLDGKRISVEGTPGNAFGAYLNGASITVYGNAQDAVGDTMNAGEIIVHGSIGDAAGYAMRGGKIYVKGDAGYRAGIHMKEYNEKKPVLIIGGSCGCFLGEYQAGGVIIVLGLTSQGKNIVGDFAATGMHGGKMILRGDCKNISFPENVSVSAATKDDLSRIDKYIGEFCTLFGYEKNAVLNSPYTKIEPNSKNPYKQMYVAN